MGSIAESDTYLYDEKLAQKTLQRVGQLMKVSLRVYSCERASLIQLLEALGALTQSPSLVDACRQFGAAATGTFLSAEL